MNYHKMASFWILLSYLTFTGVNPTLPNSLGLIFPFLLFALELYFTHTKSIKDNDLASRKISDPEIDKLRAELEIENLRASTENVRRQRSLQEALSGNVQKVEKKEWSW